MPLQAGCDCTLRRMMACRTSQAAFRELADAARTAIPDLNLTTDIICGFPGETDADFEESLAYVADIGFSRLRIRLQRPARHCRSSDARPHRQNGQKARSATDACARPGTWEKRFINAMKAKRSTYCGSRLPEQTNTVALAGLHR